MTQWFENDTFWKELYPYMFDVGRLARTSSEIKGVVALARLQKNDYILDVGCGNGRHLIELARLGFVHLTGIDRSNFLLSIAQKDARQIGAMVQFENADMRSYKQPDKFSVVLNLFSSFGYFDDPKDNQLVIKNAFDSLQSKGRMLIDVRSREHFINHFDQNGHAEIADATVDTHREPLDGFRRIKNTWMITKNGHSKSYEFTHWAYDPQELLTMCKQAGFTTCATYGGFDGRPYTLDTNRLIIVAQKN